MGAAPVLKRFDVRDVEAVAEFALHNDSDRLERFIHRALNDRIPVGAIFLELLQEASESLTRRHRNGECSAAEHAVAIGALRLAALRWAPELPRRSSLDASRVDLVHLPDRRASLSPTLYEIYCDCSGWATRHVDGAPETVDAGTVLFVLVGCAEHLDAARGLLDACGAEYACLAIEPSLAPCVENEPRQLLLNAGQVPGFLGRIEAALRPNRSRA